RRGHRPVLAGRAASTVRPLAEQHNLDWIAASVDDAAALRAAVGTVGLLLNAAGPFAATGPALMASSLQAGANYLDIANEIAVFQAAAALQRQALDKQIALMPGV